MMILTDLQHGVSFSLLLSIALSVRPEIMKILAEKCSLWGKQDNGIAETLRLFIQKRSTPEAIVALKETCQNRSPLNSDNLPFFDEQLNRAMERTIKQAGIKLLDPFEFYAYITLTIFHHQQILQWKILAPAVNTDSAEEVFSMLNNTNMVLTSTAPKISPLLAVFLVRHYHPFLIRTPPQMVEKIVEFTDPLDRNLKARTFFIRENPPEDETIAVIEANIDDMTPELISHAMQILLENHALDYTIIPAVMKKGRPGFQVQVLAKPEDRVEMEKLLLLHTTTFGVRTSYASRQVLDRSIETFDSSYGTIRVKKGLLNGQCLRRIPEFEDIAALSKKTGIPAVKLYADISAEIGQNPDKPC